MRSMNPDEEVTKELPSTPWPGTWAPPPRVRSKRRDLWTIAVVLQAVHVIAWVSLWARGWQ